MGKQISFYLGKNKVKMLLIVAFMACAMLFATEANASTFNGKLSTTTSDVDLGYNFSVTFSIDKTVPTSFDIASISLNLLWDPAYITLVSTGNSISGWSKISVPAYTNIASGYLQYDGYYNSSPYSIPFNTSSLNVYTFLFHAESLGTSTISVEPAHYATIESSYPDYGSYLYADTTYYYLHEIEPFELEITVKNQEVPEPATVALFGLGALAVGAYRRRRG